MKEQQEPFTGAKIPFCFHCGKQIEDTNDLNYLIKPSPEGNGILEKWAVHMSCVRKQT